MEKFLSPAYSGFPARIEKLIRDTGGQSALARKTGLSLGAIQRYLKGGEPTRGAMIRLCEACGVSMDWLVYGHDDNTPAPPPRNSGVIPVMGFAECGLSGWYNEVRYKISTSLEWPDPDLFAVIASGHSMAPEGIHPGFICIVSPNTRIQKGDAILIRKKDGTSSIKIFVGEDRDWLTIQGWLDPEKPGGTQSPYSDKIKRDLVDGVAPVVMVKRRP